MCLGSPSAPPPAPLLPEAARTPDVNSSASSSIAAARRKAAAGLSGTILTGARGITESAPSGAKTLLGQ